MLWLHRETKNIYKVRVKYLDYCRSDILFRMLKTIRIERPRVSTPGVESELWRECAPGFMCVCFRMKRQQCLLFIFRVEVFLFSC
uniref:Ovule protein n=1 Tax=Steinernema glaseri TaxID=37863 RepID=A0A1I7Z7S1_9BILA